MVWGQESEGGRSSPDPFTTAERDVRALVGGDRWARTPQRQRGALLAERILRLPADDTCWLFGAWARWYRRFPGDGRWQPCPPPSHPATRASARPLPTGTPVPPQIVPGDRGFADRPPAAGAFVGADLPPELTSRVRAGVESAAALPVAGYPHRSALFSAAVPAAVVAAWDLTLWCAAAPVFEDRLDPQLLGLWTPYRSAPPPAGEPRWLTPPVLATVLGPYAERLRAGRLDSAAVILRTMWVIAGALREDDRFRARADAFLAMLDPSLRSPMLDYAALPHGDHAVVGQWLRRCPPELEPALRDESSPGDRFRDAYHDLAVAAAAVAGDPAEPEFAEPRHIAAALLAADLGAVRRDLSRPVIAWLDAEIRELVPAVLDRPEHPLRRLWPEDGRLPSALGEHAQRAEPAARHALLAAMFAADVAWCRLAGGIPVHPRGFPASRALLNAIREHAAPPTGSPAPDLASPAPPSPPTAAPGTESSAPPSAPTAPDSECPAPPSALAAVPDPEAPAPDVPLRTPPSPPTAAEPPATGAWPVSASSGVGESAAAGVDDPPSAPAKPPATIVEGIDSTRSDVDALPLPPGRRGEKASHAPAGPPGVPRRGLHGTREMSETMVGEILQAAARGGPQASGDIGFPYGGPGPGGGAGGFGTPRDLDGFLRDLDDLVGLAEVKQAVRGLVAEARLAAEWVAQGRPHGDPRRHLIFLGEPGTGKETVAGLVGGAYAALGLLGSGHLSTCTADGLAGDHAAVTALAERAAGGLLLIKDAHLLDDAPEGVAALRRLMSDRRGEFAVVCAGPPAEMNAFLVGDPGFRAEFAAVIEFRPPTEPELVRLFSRFAERDLYVLDEELRLALLRRFGEMRASAGFANATSARRLFERVAARQAARLAGDRRDAAEAARLSVRDLPGA